MEATITKDLLLFSYVSIQTSHGRETNGKGHGLGVVCLYIGLFMNNLKHVMSVYVSWQRRLSTINSLLSLKYFQ